MKVTNQKYFNITENHCKENKRYIELLSVLNNRYQVKDFYPTEMKNILIDDLSKLFLRFKYSIYWFLIFKE